MGTPAAAYQGSTYDQLIDDPRLSDEHAVIIRFYAAVLGRTPDNDGVRFWLDQFDSGEWSTRRIADFFATSAEFINLYGDGTTNAQFVDAVYPNVLGRAPDATGRTFWITYLDAGNSRAEMILLVSNAPEFIQANPLPFQVNVHPGPWLERDGHLHCPGAREFEGVVGTGEITVEIPAGAVQAVAPCGAGDDWILLADGAEYPADEVSAGVLRFSFDGLVPTDAFVFRVSASGQVRYELAIAPRPDVPPLPPTPPACGEDTVEACPSHPCALNASASATQASVWTGEGRVIQPVTVTIDFNEACDDLDGLGWIGHAGWNRGTTITEADTPQPRYSITMSWNCRPGQPAEIAFDVRPRWEGSTSFEVVPNRSTNAIVCASPPLIEETTLCGALEVIDRDDATVTYRLDDRFGAAGTCLGPPHQEGDFAPWCEAAPAGLPGSSNTLRTFVNDRQVASVEHDINLPAVYRVPAIAGDILRFEYTVACYVDRAVAESFGATDATDRVDHYVWGDLVVPEIAD